MIEEVKKEQLVANVAPEATTAEEKLKKTDEETMTKKEEVSPKERVVHEAKTEESKRAPEKPTQAFAHDAGAQRETTKENPPPAKKAVDDFSEIDKFNIRRSPEERKAIEKLYTDTLTDVNNNDMVQGTIVKIVDREVIVNIGTKSDGIISSSEFRDIPNLKPGDTVQVYVEKQEDAHGQLILSRKKAKIVNAWKSIKKAHNEDIVIEGLVKRRTKGGLIVDIYGVEAFLPGSQIDVKPIRDFDMYVGKTIEVKVVKINHANDNVVVSHKVLIEKDLEEQKAAILNNLEKGQVLEGVIKNMANFGAFIDLGGVDGLLHITDISWGRINHPEDILTLDQKVNVVVLDFDDNKRRISLGIKQLTDHPWEALAPNIKEGTKVKGKVVNVADYGAFIEIMPGIEGLIHVSEMSWSQHLRNPSDFLNIGDEIEAIVLNLDRKERKMSVGIKQLTEDPWKKQEMLTKYAINTEHKGLIRNLTHFGLFIELEEGIDGLVHVSDLSWTKKIKHPSEFVKIGDKLDVKVMELDIEGRRLALSHKHIEENPWDMFETVFIKGSIHTCTITALTDKMAQLELPYGLEAQATPKNLKKQNGHQASEGEALPFKVLEFSKDDKRILMSHTSVWNKTAEQPKPKTQKPRKEHTHKRDVDKSRLGDIDALRAVKNKMANKAKKERKEANKKQANKKETSKQETSKQETSKKETNKKEANKQEANTKTEKET